MNYMKQVAEMLGIELEKVFCLYSQGELIKCRLTLYGIEYQEDDGDWTYKDELLAKILADRCEITELPWKPRRGQEYYMPSVDDGRTDYCGYTWSDSRNDDKRYENGLVCRTEDEAIEKAKKMLAALKED